MAMTTEPAARDAFVKNAAPSSTDNKHQLKLRSGHRGSSSVFPPAKPDGATTDMDGRKRPADNSVHNTPSIAAMAAQTVVAQFTSIFLMVSFIFGGCCANVGS
ncbi:hypothetical protein BDW66DRAFT_16811 [Aspergillus desertorum]